MTAIAAPDPEAPAADQVRGAFAALEASRSPFTGCTGSARYWKAFLRRIPRHNGGSELAWGEFVDTWAPIRSRRVRRCEPRLRRIAARQQMELRWLDKPLMFDAPREVPLILTLVADIEREHEDLTAVAAEAVADLNEASATSRPSTPTTPPTSNDPPTHLVASLVAAPAAPPLPLAA